MRERREERERKREKERNRKGKEADEIGKRRGLEDWQREKKESCKLQKIVLSISLCHSRIIQKSFPQLKLF